MYRASREAWTTDRITLFFAKNSARIRQKLTKNVQKQKRIWCEHPTESILPLEITYLNTEAQWGDLLLMELHTEPQQINMAKRVKSKSF